MAEKASSGRNDYSKIQIAKKRRKSEAMAYVAYSAIHLKVMAIEEAWGENQSLGESRQKMAGMAKLWRKSRHQKPVGYGEEKCNQCNGVK